MNTTRGARLPQIYSVMFENPKKPGYWSEPLGRFETKLGAAKWADGFSHTVVLEVLEKGEALRLSSKTTLKRLMAGIKAGLCFKEE